MIENRYEDVEAANYRAAAGNNAADQELGERVYTSRLIGQNPDLLMHGGGNTSVKVQRADLFGKIRDVLHVKGSGWDLDVIEAPGLPGVWLEPLTRLRGLDSLSDESMVNYQRSNLLNSLTQFLISRIITSRCTIVSSLNILIPILDHLYPRLIN